MGISYWFVIQFIVLFLGIRANFRRLGGPLSGLVELDRGRFGKAPVTWGLGTFFVALVLVAVTEDTLLRLLVQEQDFSPATEMAYLFRERPLVPLAARLGAILACGLFVFGLRRGRLDAFGLHAPLQDRYLAETAKSIAAMGIVSLLLGASLEWLVRRSAWDWEHLDPFTQYADDYTQAPVWLFVAMVLLLGPLIEEFLFRGLLYPVIAEWWGVAMGIVATAFVFSALHIDQGIYGFLARFLVGIFLAFLYERTDSIWYPVLAHSGYNLGAHLVGLALEALLP